MLSTYPPLPQKSVCMSMTRDTVLAGRRSPFQGHGYGVAATKRGVRAGEASAGDSARESAWGMSHR